MPKIAMMKHGGTRTHFEMHDVDGFANFFGRRGNGREIIIWIVELPHVSCTRPSMRTARMRNCPAVRTGIIQRYPTRHHI